MFINFINVLIHLLSRSDGVLFTLWLDMTTTAIDTDTFHFLF